MRSAALLSAVLAFTVYGQLVIKARALVHASQAGKPGKLHYLITMFTDIWVLSSLAAAVVASACWMLAVEQLDVGYAYPFVALSFVLVPIGASIVFGESLSAIQLVGFLLIIAGVTLSALVR